MPPFVPHKRRSSTSSSERRNPKSEKKPSLFETVDKPNASTTLHDNKTFFDSLNVSDDQSSLSDINSEEFVDALQPPSPKKQTTSRHGEDEEEVDWEDAIGPEVSAAAVEAPGIPKDLELTLNKTVQPKSSNILQGTKKGPTKIERQIRNSTHCMHVQFLLFHNWIRSGWACDKEVQRILVGQLPSGVRSEVEKWRVASGLESDCESHNAEALQRKGNKWSRATDVERNQRDWGKPAEKQEKGAPNMSRGDPLLRLLSILAAYWRKRFTVTAPGLRKQGYKSLSVLEGEVASWRDDKYSVEEHGERINGIDDFRRLARLCEGSRDVGAQLFTALVRGLGLEARLVASLQPLGFGWNKNEEAETTNNGERQKVNNGHSKGKASANGDTDEDESIEPEARPHSKAKAKRKRTSSGRQRKSKREDEVIEIAGSSDNGDVDEPKGEGLDDASVIDVTPSTPRKRPNAKYDRDLPAPTYWIEVISPITNDVYPVHPWVLTQAVVTRADQLVQFEPRGAKADKAKQVIAYVIAYSPDGTAKDVTTRYLKRHLWPGRTKGVRMPVEKVPVYDYRGKIKCYKECDWFRTVISGYERNHAMRTIVDDLEEAKDLKPLIIEKKVRSSEETLQGYRASAEFVLERHLRREEALRPGAKTVKTFAIGKGDDTKEEPVYRRRDVVSCRTSESWHKEGRAVRPGEQPIKKVPVRAVTMNRKREVEEAERDGGEKLMQGLYARDQTDWIIPPPIKDGVIPKNSFGNMDCYVPSMVPKGAMHIPLRSTVRICKRLGIDHAEAVTGFEFGKRMAVPVITGVVVAEENGQAVVDEWERDEEERRIKEEGKREKTALAMWRKWLMGLRIIERVKEEYGGAETDMKEEMNPFINQSKAKKTSKSDTRVEDPLEAEEGNANGGIGSEYAEDPIGELEGGGFLPEGWDEDRTPNHKSELFVEGDLPLTNGRVSPLPSPVRRAAQANVQDHDPVDRPKESKKKALRSSNKSSKANGARPPTIRASEPRATSRRKRKAPPESEDEPLRSTKRQRRQTRKETAAMESHIMESASYDSEENNESDESFKPDGKVIASPEIKRRGRPAGEGRVMRGKTAT